MPDLITPRPSGLYCAAGDFHIDPWRPVPRAVISHAHSDHARSGCKAYLCTDVGRDILAERVGKSALIETLPYGQPTTLGDTRVSLHPAGHILGSAQVRVEHKGEVWVVSGDYNNAVTSPACAPFEPVPCHVFITESTFGLPIYRWPDPAQVFDEIRQWWAQNAAQGITSILPAYPLGKSQRLLAGLGDGPGPLAVHGNVQTFLPHYCRAGVALPLTIPLRANNLADLRGRALVITSSAAQETGLLTKLGPTATALASGWMTTRAARRSRAADRGFILSDHADWPGLLRAIEATGAPRIGVTHGQLHPFSRYLRDNKGLDAFIVPTRFTGEPQNSS